MQEECGTCGTLQVTPHMYAQRTHALRARARGNKVPQVPHVPHRFLRRSANSMEVVEAQVASRYCFPLVQQEVDCDE